MQSTTFVEGIRTLKLYKYRVFGKLSEEIITKSELWYANPNSFNDPFDMNLSFRQSYRIREIHTYIKKFYKNFKDTKDLPKHEQKIFIKKSKDLYRTSEQFVKTQNDLTTKQIDNTGVLSLSSRCDSILMWSHYSEEHRGLVFEFDFSKEKLELNEFPYEVVYKNKYDLLSYVVNFDERSKQMQKILLTKFTDWKYENEYRIIDLNYQGAKKFKKENLTAIIFGLKSKEKDIKVIIELCRNNGYEHVSFKKAVKVEGTFSLDILPLM